MVQVLVQAFSDEIVFSRGHTSSLGAGLGLWVHVRPQSALPPALLPFVPFPLISGVFIASDAAHCSLCRAVNSHSVTPRPVHRAASCSLKARAALFAAQCTASPTPSDPKHLPWYLCRAEPICAGCGAGEQPEHGVAVETRLLAGPLHFDQTLKASGLPVPWG